MVDFADLEGRGSVNVTIRNDGDAENQLRTSLLEANYANKQEPNRVYPEENAPLRLQKINKTTNVMLTQLAADILAILSQGEKSVRNNLSYF